MDRIEKEIRDTVMKEKRQTVYLILVNLTVEYMLYLYPKEATRCMRLALEEIFALDNGDK